MATKQDPDSKRVDKALKLYRLLLINDKKYSTTELTKILNCSKQSIRAVIDDLNANPEINICEEFNEHTRVKKYFIEHCKHGMNEPIALEGYRQMELCRDLIGELLPEDDLLELNKALFNAANYLPRKDRCNFKTFSIATGFSKGHINYSNSKEILHKLYDCITQKKCCSLSYQKEVNGTIKEYYFAPKRIICLRDTLYIKGWIVEYKSNRIVNKYQHPTNFSVHRIQNIQILKDKTSKELSDVVNKQDKFGLISENEPFKVILKFTNPHAITYVADRIWSSDQKLEFNEDGSLTLSFTTDSYYETFTFALSFGRGVEVVSPEVLRQEVKAEIKEMKKIYCNS